MAKTRITASEKLIKDCFIEVRGKASFQSTAETNYKNSNRSEFSELNVSAITKESLNDTDNSDNNITENQSQRQKSTETEIKIIDHAEDDKSDYGEESFCSEDDSYKGSEITNVTSRSSLSGCSSLLQTAGLKYDRRITELIKSRKNGDDEETDNYDEEEGLSILVSEDEARHMLNRRHLTRSGRRNMSFTNDELRKIERENELLLKKIMSHQKPNCKINKPLHGGSRASSSAINRKRQQKKIEEDNMILLRRIQQAKPCAIPRTSAPANYKFGTM